MSTRFNYKFAQRTGFIEPPALGSQMKKAVVATEVNIVSISNSLVGERWLFAGLLVIVALTPLPLGSNLPFPMAMLCLCSGFLLISWTVLWGFKYTTLHLHSSDLKWALYGYGAVCLWIGIQWAPMMPTALSDPVWQSAAKLIEVDIEATLSVNPNATLSVLMHFLAYGSIFWLSFQMTRSSERAWALIRAVAYISCAYAIYGIVIYMAGNEWVVIYPKTSYLDSLTGTFVNRNSYATNAGLALLCATALLLDHMKPYFALKHPIRAKLVIIVEELVSKSALKTLAVLSIAISLLLSASRAGIFSSGVGLIVLILIFLGQKRLRVRHLIYAALVSAMLASTLIAVSGNSLSKRMGSDDIDTSFAFRNYMYGLTWDAIKASPLKGTGLGTYADVIPAFKEDRFDAPTQRWDKAHNTYLENALELGLPAATTLNLSIFLVALIAAGGISRRRRDKLIPALGVCATVLVALHSLVDFSLQIPAVAILYACIMGVAASQSWSASASNASQTEAAPTP